jgi:hypothetical protein
MQSKVIQIEIFSFMYLFIEGRRGYYYLARYPELVIYEYTHLFRIMYV